MKIITKTRGAGKTKELIELAAKSGLLIICKDQNETSRIMQYATSLGLTIPNPMTYHDLATRNPRINKAKGILLDEIELFLSSLTSVPVYAITGTSEEIPEQLTDNRDELMGTSYRNLNLY